MRNLSPRSPTVSACVEMLFRTERPGGWRDRLAGARDLLRERRNLAGLAAAARLLLAGGQRDPFPARIRACKAVGWVDAVEFWSWRGKDIGAVAAALEETGLTLAAFAAEPAGGLVDPARHPAFLEGLRDSLQVARRLRARALIVVAGESLPDRPRPHQRAALVAALQAAAPLAEAAGVTLLLEPLNSRLDHPGAFLDRTTEGLDVVAEVGHQSVRLLYDAYHAAMMGEAAEQLFAGERGALVGHVHLADAPGRREPGSGTIDWMRMLAALRTNGYAGPLGLEFRPSRGHTAAALDTAVLRRLRDAAGEPGAIPLPL